MEHILFIQAQHKHVFQHLGVTGSCSKQSRIILIPETLRFTILKNFVSKHVFHADVDKFLKSWFKNQININTAYTAAKLGMAVT